MQKHKQKVDRISKFLKQRQSTAPLSLQKKSVSHQVPKPHDKLYDDEKLDVSDLTEILHLDPEQKICIAEPGITFFDLLNIN